MGVYYNKLKMPYNGKLQVNRKEFFNSICSINFTEPNAPPAYVKGYILNVTSVLVQWRNVPVSDQNGIILSYTVTYTALPDGNPQTQAVNAPTTETIMAGLNENTNYSISVFASTVKGDGNISSPIIVTTGLKGKCSDTLYSVYFCPK